MIIKDFLYALRLLAKKPGFSTLTTLVMAAGIGLSVYMFSFINTMIFKDLPFEDSDTLMQIGHMQNGARINTSISLHDYLEIREGVNGLKEFGAYNIANMSVSGRDGARRYEGARVEPNIFKLSRTEPLLGRGFKADDNALGARPVVVIGHELWRNLFAANEDVIGKNLLLDGVSTEIIGVMPEAYKFPTVAELWVPMREDAKSVSRGEASRYWGLAHLKEGMSLEEVNAEIRLVMQRVEQDYPETNSGISAFADSIQSAAVEDGMPVIYAMQITAVLILILASVNVGNLLLSRAIERGKETAIRVALGAPRARIISQMVWESAIICCLGGIIGLLLLAWGLEATKSITKTFFDGSPNFWWEFRVDAYTIKLFLLVLISTIFCTGFLPAWINSGADFNAVLRDGTRGALGKKAGRLNRTLVISEIFISIVVLVVAGAILVSTYKGVRTEYGGKIENTLIGRMTIAESRYPTDESKNALVRSLQAQLQNSNAISSVALVSALPGDYTAHPSFAVEGVDYSGAQGESYPKTNFALIVPGALDTLGVELKEGRYFNSSDDGLGKNSVILTEVFARQYFPMTSPIGKRIKIVSYGSEWLTVVGVVERVVHGAPNEARAKGPAVYRPFSQNPSYSITIAAKMNADRETVTRALRSATDAVAPGVPVYGVELYSATLKRILAPMLFISTIFILLGGAAVILAASGIYGVMSNTINQRIQEIGVKRALGARDELITAQFLKSGGTQLLLGGLPGILFSGFIGLGIGAVLGISNFDLLITIIVFALLISAVVLTATYIPTKRALKMEPSEALRHE
ncbi:MAG: putative ABC transport system permease protein [Flavobacteriales bacterium]|jgi:putative ABC transport system permease protein